MTPYKQIRQTCCIYQFLAALLASLDSVRVYMDYISISVRISGLNVIWLPKGETGRG